MSSSRRCPQCWQVKPLDAFVGRRGKPIRLCAVCAGRYARWETKSLEEKMSGRARVDPAPTGRIIWQARTHNTKLGPIPASISERGTCPPSCGLYDAGCYAEYGMLGAHWRRVSDRGLTWDEFLRRVEVLPVGQLWRHNVAGDLAGVGEAIDVEALAQLVEANRGLVGFTFTHKYGPENREAIRWAVLRGLAINLSADTLAEADRLSELRIAPVAVVLQHDAPGQLRTSAGRRVVVCPAQTTEGMTCADCRLCAKSWRKSIVGFRAHGQFKKHVPALVQLRRKSEVPEVPRYGFEKRAAAQGEQS